MPIIAYLKRLLTPTLLSYLYLALLLALWAIYRLFGDVLWLPTLLLFGPRWPWAVPLAFLLPATGFWLWKEGRKVWAELANAGNEGLPGGAFGRLRRSLVATGGSTVRVSVPLLLAAAVLVFPIMGYRVPWRRLGTRWQGATARILTCNLGGREAALLNVFRDSRRLSVDVVCLQECPPIKPSRPIEGWNVVREGQIAVASPYSIDQVQISRREFPPSRWPPVNAVVAVVHHPDRDLRVCAVHLRTPRQGISEVLDQQTGISPYRSGGLKGEIAIRRAESKALVAWLDTQPPVDVVAGDFNMSEGSAIYRRYWASRFANAFSLVGLGLGHTKHTPVGPFQYGLRIDHILLNNQAGGVAPLRCRVGVTVGSDHDPVVADMVSAQHNRS